MTQLRLLPKDPGLELTQPGDCWFRPDLDDVRRADGSTYLATTAAERGRPPLEVCLAVLPADPTQDRIRWPLLFTVDSRASTPPHSGWRVFGTVDRLTVEPSIWLNQGRGDLDWHGFITDGVIRRC